MALIERIREIKERIEKAKSKCLLNNNVVIMAAVKQRMPSEIEEALKGGISFIGENRVQEAISHLAGISKESREKMNYHFIGNLQKNKARKAVEIFDSIDSIDSIELVEIIENLCIKANLKKDVMIEVNMGEEQKGGAKIENVKGVAERIFNSRSLTLTGIMGVPPFFEESEKSRPFFRKLYKLFKDIEKSHPDKENFKYLSMGMSNDFEVAVEEGSTMVRIGTFLFGPRRRENES